ncbi:MAG TPA: hydantoinase/oxoprolinase family protein [Solirubrobacteraceae bacterium]|jgi:N-methylhydantoinase A|nr:hydantoinase/oxoprolinase family protein [Solirubrobacteraceae bacterium]
MLLGVDVGGTFTDAVLLAEDGTVHTAKVPSTPGKESDAVMAAIARVLKRAEAEPREVERFAHGMTVATNALLEGHTALTALIATEGFADVIELGRQARPHLYRLCEAAPDPLVPADLRFSAPERIGPHETLRALDPARARTLVESVAMAAPEAVAVSLLHSYRDPSHERLLGELVAELLPGAALSLSHDLVGTFREYERTATTALDAALSPALASYLQALRERTAAGGIPEPAIMQSSGGLTSSARAGAHAALTVLSGPAGGVSGAMLLAAMADESDVACFDMGGTSCDVCLIEGGRVPETAERIIAGRPVSLPALDIHTVGAGGGSIAWRDSGGALRVGPASAGAVPGPACYGRGGTDPTVTDANLLLGRLPVDRPLAEGLRLNAEAAARAIGRLAAELGLEALECAEGIVAVAEAEMLAALRLVTVERGIDPRSFALMPFGGAGPLHAAALAESLGIGRVLCPRASGVLSALGLAAAAPRRDAAHTVMLSGKELSAEALDATREGLLKEAGDRLDEPPARARVRYELRYRGQSFELPIEEDRDGEAEPERLNPAQLRAAFDEAHETRYSYRDERAEIELVNIRVSVWGRAPSLRPRARRGTTPPDRGTASIVFGGEKLQATSVFGEPEPGMSVDGPAMFALAESTLLVPPGWSASVDHQGTILMRAEGDR